MKRVLLSSILPLFLYSGTNVVLPIENNEISLTVFNNNKASVHLEKSVDLKVGEQNLVLKDIPEYLIEDSVIPVFTGNKVNINYQKHIENTVGMDNLLKSYMNKRISYIQDGTEFSGILISVNPTMVLNEDLNQITIVNNDRNIIFEKVDNVLIGSNLLWNVNVENPGKAVFDLNYVTNNINWKINYSIKLKKGNRLDLQSWITIDNKTLKSFKKANILVADEEYNKETKDKSYTLYNLKKKVDIEANTKTLINFISNPTVKYSKYSVSEFKQNKGNHGNVSLKFFGAIGFDNLKENGVGYNLPAGDINVYEQNNKGQYSLISTEKIKYTPKFKTVLIDTGENKNISGSIVMKKYIMSKNHEKGIQEFTFKNNSKEEQTVKFSLISSKYGSLTAKETCSAECSYFSKKSNVKEYIIHVRPEGEYSFRRTFEVYY